MVLCQDLPHVLCLWVDTLTTKFGSLLDRPETGGKTQNVISSSVQHLISMIFAIHVSFVIPLPMMHILLTKLTSAEIWDHNLFTLF